MKDYKAILDTATAELARRFPHFSIDLWFGDAEIILIDEKRTVISVYSTLKVQTITRKYLEDLTEIISEQIGRPTEILLITQDEKKNYAPVDKGELEVTLSKSMRNVGEPLSPMNFNFEYTFENFIVGTSNQFAHAACTAVAKNPATDYNPLFIYSASGLGKTHLLNAIMNELKRANESCSIIYVKGEEFTNQMIEAIKGGSQVEFRNKYRKADVLLIDAIQFIAGKESTQEEFFHTFNALYESHKQIIMTSDKPPKDIKTLEDRLKTRFEWGLIADIQPPDYELRIAIMKKKAKMIGMELPDEVLAYIAERLKTNIREIEGAVKRICARSFLTGETITLETAKVCLEAFVTVAEPPSVTAERIVDRVAKKYGVSCDDIYGRKRTKHIAFARATAIYIIRKITDMSFPAIGKIFDRDHSTIISANQMIVDEFEKNPLLEIEINDLIKEITE